MNQSKKKYVKVLLNLTIAVIIALLVIFFLPRLLVFFAPFVTGYVIALIASPIVKFFEEKMKIKRKAGTAVVVVAVIALVILCVYLIGTKLVQEIIGLSMALPDMWNGMEADLKQIGQNMDIFFNRLPVDIQNAMASVMEQMDSFTADLMSSISTPTINAVGSFAKQLPNMLIAVIMCLLSAYFFVAEKDYLHHFVRTYTPKSILKRWDLLKRSLKRAVGGYFKAQLKIEVFVYVLLLVGLSILGIDYAILIAFGIAVLDFLPFFGAGAVMLPWALVKFLSADYTMTIGLLIIWGLGQLLRQIIQPKIVGDSIGVAPIPTLFLLFIGFKVGGVIGMIVAVPIGIILQNMYQEGLFDTTINSVRILVAGVNDFRQLTKEDFGNMEMTEKESKEESKEDKIF